MKFNITNAVGKFLLRAVGANVDIDNPITTNNTPQDLGSINNLSALDKALARFGLNSTDMAGMGAAYQAWVRIESERIKKYQEYDVMDAESEVISTACDIYSEDSTDFDKFIGSRIWITSDDSDLADMANNVLAKLKIDAQLPRIARGLCKYGDFMLRIIGTDSDYEDKKSDDLIVPKSNKDPKNAMKSGIVRLDTSYHPKDVIPIVRDYKLLGYYVKSTNTGDIVTLGQIQEKDTFAPWDFVHFAVPGDSNFVEINNKGFYINDFVEKDKIRGNVPEYGQSLLQAARRPYKRSKLMHDILAIARLSKSTMRRVFKFSTNATNPINAIKDLAIFKKTMEKVGGIDTINGDLDYQGLLDRVLKDIYVPIMKDARGDFNVQTIGGEVNVQNIVDVELFDNRLYMSLRIPKEFLNFDNAMGGGKETLLLKDIRYAKRVSKLSNAIKAGIKELIMIDMAYKQKKVNYEDFEVNMSTTSISDDLQRLDYFGASIANADVLIKMVESFDAEKDLAPEDLKMNKGYLIYYIFKNIIKLPGFDINKFMPGLEEKYNGKSVKDPAKKKIGAFVESNRKLIKNMMSEKFGIRLSEIVNSNIEKCYHTNSIVELKTLKMDTAGLKAAMGALMELKEND